ncbi:hypothetical protein HAHE_42250 [Haloferula helveola]|uniref:Uncharacterized protein n=1 Tax=Haloferula helveola TaxID=490095 RepID=A0ABN6HDH4_9BACT|nr:hypothetical protein HAHE_42250 [Haloferula helveola]
MAAVIVRTLILVSALILIAAAVGRWWFWGRTQARGRRTECALTVAELYERLGVKKRKPSDLRDAAALGAALRDGGLILLEKDGLKAAKKRRVGWWNLRILPVLVVLILVFAFLKPRFAPAWVAAVGAALVALHVVMRVNGIGVELKAVQRAWKEIEGRNVFRRMDEAEEVQRCARASVWDTILPW